LTNAAAGAIGWARVRPVLAGFWRGAAQAIVVIGLSGVLENLKSWSVLAGRLQQAPGLAEIARSVGLAVHAIVEPYQAVVRPLFDFLLGWAPFEVVAPAQDAIVAALFLALAQWPDGGAHFRAWRRMSDAQRRAIVTAAQEAGLKVGAGDARVLIEAVEAVAWGRSYPGIMTEEDARLIESKYVERARARFGPSFDAFAGRQGALGGAPPRLHRMPQNLSLRLVWAFAALVCALAAVDWAFLGLGG
jgi:hypothetical protein